MEKIKNIEFLRFIFTCLICVYHFFLWSKLQYSSIKSVFYLGYSNASQYIFVEFFFILAGYFLYYSVQKEKAFLCFFTKKLKRLYPAMISATLFIFIFSLFFSNLKFQILPNLYTFLMLQSTVLPKAAGNLHTLWFVCAYFWITCFYFALIKAIDNKTLRNLIIGCLIIWSLSTINIMGNGKFIMHREVYLGLCGGIIRAIPTVGIGYFIAILIEVLITTIEKYRNSKLISLIFGLSECAIFCLIIYYTSIKHEKIFGDYLCLFLIILLTISFICRIGFLSKFLNNHVSMLLGKYSYSIYVSQIVVWEIFRNYIWIHESFVKNNFYLTLTLFVITCIIWGITSHHIIEKPIFNLLNGKVNGDNL